MVARAWLRRPLRIRAVGRCRYQAVSAVTPTFQATICSILRLRRIIWNRPTITIIGVGCDTAARRDVVTAADCIQSKARGKCSPALLTSNSRRGGRNRQTNSEINEEKLYAEAIADKKQCGLRVTRVRIVHMWYSSLAILLCFELLTSSVVSTGKRRQKFGAFFMRSQDNYHELTKSKT